VVTARDFKEAMLSHGGMSAVRVVLVTDATNKPQQEVSGRWEGISSLNNFLYQEDCVTVWKACNIGEGKNIPWSQLQGYSYNNNIHAYLILVIYLYSDIFTTVLRKSQEKK